MGLCPDITPSILPNTPEYFLAIAATNFAGMGSDWDGRATAQLLLDYDDS